MIYNKVSEMKSESLKVKIQICFQVIDNVTPAHQVDIARRAHIVPLDKGQLR